MEPEEPAVDETVLPAKFAAMGIDMTVVPVVSGCPDTGNVYGCSIVGGCVSPARKLASMR